MHERLREHAEASVRLSIRLSIGWLVLWSVVAVSVLLHAPSTGPRGSAAAAVLALVLAVPLAVVVRPRKPLKRMVTSAAPSSVTSVVDLLDIVPDSRPCRVLIVDDSAPNFGTFRGLGGNGVLVTSGAVEEMRRAESEAVIALLRARLDDVLCRRALFVERLLQVSVALLFVIGSASSFVVIYAYLAFVLPVASLHVTRRRTIHSRHALEDAIAVATTRNPIALINAIGIVVDDDGRRPVNHWGVEWLTDSDPDSVVALTQRLERLEAALDGGSPEDVGSFEDLERRTGDDSWL